MEKESEGRKFSNYGGWQSHDIQLDAIPEFKELHRQIKQKIDEVCLDLGEHFKLDFDNAWININRGSDYNTVHVHPFSIISGCFYLKVNENSGKFEFFRGDAAKHYVCGMKTP